ncbi:RNA-binding protein [Nocardioides eburneiflavus]|uniref:RNA-binding protein n=1 Tax=Nocardioides eburneiflavus TaxID=2518372 RepID=A0A4Z1CEJ4_9ACTN|nr:RNA-binding protein [Nocardioides eburneiflavus]TGN63758.1 RNA-binding protein [Nocardioides eburneiflavus]
MGLIHASDLTAWRQWQESRHRLRQLRHAVHPGPGPQPQRFVLTTYDPEPRLLVALDSSSPTSHAALVEPLARLDLPVAVLSPGPAPDLGRPPLTQQDVGTDLPDALRGVVAVVSLGHYLPRGELAHHWARDLGAQSVVVQHGALTPYAPPLPPGARLLAWSDADADFWRSGRTDVEHEVVGSQLLWHAGLVTGAGAPSSTSDRRLTYLGQMHAAELSRARLVRAAAAHCRAHDAVYRPHPSERDRLSRLAHGGFRRLGITVDGSTPLARLAGPVVSVFSTGVIEAAAQGRDAWVDFPRPPAWLAEFWERYGMHRSGSAPTPPPPRPDVEPSRRVAEVLREVAG